MKEPFFKKYIENLPHYHVMLRVFLAQLYGREPHDHVLVRNPTAESKSILCIEDIVTNLINASN
jgi:hypothetical protein